jgi:hypothetical protein
VAQHFRAPAGAIVCGEERLDTFVGAYWVGIALIFLRGIWAPYRMFIEDRAEAQDKQSQLENELRVSQDVAQELREGPSMRLARAKRILKLQADSLSYLAAEHKNPTGEQRLEASNALGAALNALGDVVGRAAGDELRRRNTGNQRDDLRIYANALMEHRANLTQDDLEMNGWMKKG